MKILAGLKELLVDSKNLIIIYAVLAVPMLASFWYHSTPERIKEREAQVQQEKELARQKAEAQARICHVNVYLTQTRFSLEPEAHLKDAFYAAQFPLPTSCEHTKKLSIGADIGRDLHAGNLLIKGSLSGWRMTVEDVPSFSENADKTNCRVELQLSQNRMSLSSLNKVAFKWDIPSEVYNAVDVGHDFARSGYQSGGSLIRGSSGVWNLKLLNKVGCQEPS